MTADKSPIKSEIIPVQSRQWFKQFQGLNTGAMINARAWIAMQVHGLQCRCIDFYTGALICVLTCRLRFGFVFASNILRMLSAALTGTVLFSVTSL